MEDPNKTYRTLYFIVEHGNRLATVVAAAVLVLGPALWATTGSVWAIPLCVFGSALLYLLLRSYAELVRVIVDMLLPK